MKLQLHRKTLPDDVGPDELYLSPENEKDRKLLGKLVASYRLVGFGRHPETGNVLHARIGLTAIEESSRIAGVNEREN